MQHYTERFKEAYDGVLEVAEQQGEDAARLAFRDAMLKLGHDERVRNLYRVRDKLSAKAAFFKPNGPQEDFLKQRSGRDMILKVRQVGFTTLSCVEALDYVLWEPNRATGIMAHLQNLVVTIFNDIVKYSYNHFKKDWGHLYNPTQKTDSSTSLSFSDDGLGRELNSIMRVMYDFRGKTVHFLHVAEAAFVEADRLLGSINSVPITGEIRLETTPNGMGGEFYRLWTTAKKKPKVAPYKPYFIPWFLYYPETTDQWDPDWPEDLDARERELKAHLGDMLKPHHLWWRRWCIEANCQGETARFEREYPSDDEECFLTNESQVFPTTVIKAQRKHVCEPSKTGFVVMEGRKTNWIDDEIGTVDVWDEPNPAHTYVIGADPAGGTGKDKAAAYVKDQVTKKQVARIWADMDPVEFGNELYKLALYYNSAWINPEENNHGHTVIATLKSLGYTKIYKREILDELTRKTTNKLGFLTTSSSKLRITEQLKTSLKDNKLVVQDTGFIAEATSFMQYMSRNGRTVKREAAPDAHDDLVMAAALTEEMDRVRPHNADTSATLEANPFFGDVQWDPETGFLIA